MRITQVIQKNDVISPKKTTSVLQARQSRSQASDEACAGLPQPKRPSPEPHPQPVLMPVYRVSCQPDQSKEFSSTVESRTWISSLRSQRITELLFKPGHLWSSCFGEIFQHSWFLKGPCNHPPPHPSIIFHLSRIRSQWHLFPQHFPRGAIDVCFQVRWYVKSLKQVLGLPLSHLLVEHVQKTLR